MLANVNIDGFLLQKVIGSGNFSVVYRGIQEKNKKYFAVKVLEKNKIRSPKLLQLIRTQINVLRECKNQNVIGYLHHCQNEQNIFIFVQYCNGGDLQEYLRRQKKISEEKATEFLKQILNGFKGLHEVNAMHRDFKCANVMLDNGVCKIADMGFAKQFSALDPLDRMAVTVLGTPMTSAPEVMEEKQYGMQADIYSVGVVYYQMLYSKYPFFADSKFKLLQLIRKGKLFFDGINISKHARDFIQKCLKYDPRQRFSWKALFQHPLIAGQKENNHLFMMKSNLNIEEIQEFYKKVDNIKGKQIFINQPVAKPQIKEQINFKKNSKEQAQKIIKQGIIQQQIRTSIAKYEDKYLRERNSLLFVFKFIEPQVMDLLQVRVNHNIALFFMEKASLIKLKHFCCAINKRQNIFKIDKYFKEFIESQFYREIQETINFTLQIMQMQVEDYLQKIDKFSCNQQIRKELSMQQWINPSWKNLVHDYLADYQFSLYEVIEKANQKQKKSIIKIIVALSYYKDNKSKELQQFDIILQNINFKLQEDLIKQKLNSIYQ